MGVKHLVAAAGTSLALGWGIGLGTGLGIVPKHPAPKPQPRPVIVRKIISPQQAQYNAALQQNAQLCAYFSAHKLPPPAGVSCKK